jgi:hypothetical protein
MANITSLIGTQWFFGLAFNESDVTSTDHQNVIDAAQYAKQILGSNLLGMAIGNEPDL